MEFQRPRTRIEQEEAPHISCVAKVHDRAESEDQIGFLGRDAHAPCIGVSHAATSVAQKASTESCFVRGDAVNPGAAIFAAAAGFFVLLMPACQAQQEFLISVKGDFSTRN